MLSRAARSLILILIVFLAAAWVAWPANSGLHLSIGDFTLSRDISVHQGLDLQGGLQVLLEADLPEGQAPSGEAMDTARQIVENRVNALGVTEPLVQRQGGNRIVVELPGIQNPDEAIATLKETGLLEFVDAGFSPLDEGQIVQTDCANPSLVDCGTSALGEGEAPPAPEADPALGPVLHTVMTGAAIDQVSVVPNPNTGRIGIAFTLTPEGAGIFGQHTSTHTQQYLAIVLDKKVISSPVIQNAITTGQGEISGAFTVEEANQLAIQLRYGSLPVPLAVVQSKTIGPTLGEDSIRKSLVAGAVGLAAVAIYMLLYYRLPGALADLALLVYATLVFAAFKLIPVTLTLPGIAGFILSVGVAVDANILIFERMKEELRAGRALQAAVEIGHRRAWPSIRDSNISTLITCAILFWFGSTFGASIVKGFALTLSIGVVVSLFSALFVTRALMHLVLDRIDFSARRAWLGV